MGKQSSNFAKTKTKLNGPTKSTIKKNKSELQRFDEFCKSIASKFKQPKPIESKPTEWDPINAKYMTINMNEYSPLKLPKICNLICDTPIFSRLKRIKQLGSCSYVFPSATHTRFEHSIGTACLAFKFVKHLQFLSEDFKLSGNEMLDVILASLLRNLGHPAFSYLYEECFATPDLHQKMSVKLFDKMLVDSPKTNHGLRQHLTDRDFDLIRALIDPPPMFNINGEWNLPISPKKAYIFDIVNNLRNGLDVDKLDYIYRDGLRSGLNKYSINMNIIKRFIKSAFIGLDYSNRFHCLKFPESNANEIRLIFESKAELFKTLYYHKNVLAKDKMEDNLLFFTRRKNIFL